VGFSLGFCFSFYASLRIEKNDRVLGNCEDDEKGCADGDPRWEVIFIWRLAEGIQKPFLAFGLKNGYGLSLRILVDKSSVYLQKYTNCFVVSETVRSSMKIEQL